jgi:hypothetical protein
VAIVALRKANLQDVTVEDHIAVLRLLSKRHHALIAGRTRVVCRLHTTLCFLAEGKFPRRLRAEQAAAPVPPPSSPSPTLSEKNIPEPEVETTPSFRTIVADVLMVDGDFYIVRGEKGEIRIEVTPKTVVSESFNYGDRIKTKVLPDDKALTIERANPKDPVGITTQ